MVFIEDIAAAEDAFEGPPVLVLVLLLVVPFGMLRLPERRWYSERFGIRLNFWEPCWEK